MIRICGVFLFLIVSVLAKSEVDYCAMEKELCGEYKHLACNNTGEFSKSCPPDRKLIDLRDFRIKFVQAHNHYRNIVASGKLPGFEPAAKMPSIVWDDELARLAELNVKKCIFAHDDCYHTPRFRMAGQCLAGLYSGKQEELNMTAMIENSVGGWFAEHKNVDMSYITNFRMDDNFHMKGHFLELMVERISRCGCAMVQFSDDAYPEFYRVNIACNYDSVYTSDYPVYEPGKRASKCKTGPNPVYPGLCSLKEEINPNWY